MKRLISFILCMLMLLSLVPATAFATDGESDTRTAYDLPEAGDKVNIVCTGKAEEAEIGGSGSTYNIHRDGEGYAHTVASSRRRGAMFCDAASGSRKNSAEFLRLMFAPNLPF